MGRAKKAPDAPVYRPKAMPSFAEMCLPKYSSNVAEAEPPTGPVYRKAEKRIQSYYAQFVLKYIE
jgi:hypothetical protein